MRKYDLARINRIDYDTTLSKGDKVIVYQVADPRRSERAAEQWQKTPKSRRGKIVGEPARGTASASAGSNPEPKPTAPAPKPAAPEAPAAAKSSRPTKQSEPAPDGPVTRPTQAD
jgi:hypothetical protein